MEITLQEIRELKKQFGYTNLQLAELSGVPVSTVQKVLGGTTSAPRQTTLRRLAEALMRGREDPLFPGRPAPAAMHTEIQEDGSPAKIHPSGRTLPEGTYLLGESPAPCFINRKQQGEYTIQDYDALPEEHRAELIDGVLYDMAAPSGVHQDILLILGSLFRDHIRKNHEGCKVYVAPRDVQPDPKDDRTIVQPDILVVCDLRKITPRRVLGAPDLIVEILSPATRQKDLHVKASKYASTGVREYWIVDPDKRIVLVYRFTESRFPSCFSFSDTVPVGIWDDLLLVDFAMISEEIDSSP